MQRILVTGANKGIGLALVRAILERDDKACVILGSRDTARGQAAIDSLIETQPQWADRLVPLDLEVTSTESVENAAAHLRSKFPEERTPLHGIVNNAGIGLGSAQPTPVFEVNVRGVQRVCEAFLPLLDPAHGRIVNITSAAGPKFVSECPEDLRQFLTDDGIQWSSLEGFMDEYLDPATGALEGHGLRNSDAYGLSKACANSYTLCLAREHPNLSINACTPGWIDTDLTRYHAEASGKSPTELGMKPASEGTRSALYLLFEPLEGNGRYYGSDAVRSPLDAYRAPGDPPFQD
jgi:NAD(P)-dependent dehydrogenase (short-subunit alcohol dehydrogenase family)